MSIVSGSLGAVMGSKATRQAANTSAQAQRDAANTAAATIEEQSARAESLNQPFYEAGIPALAQLQSGIMGGPISYRDPQYRMLTSDDITAFNDNVAGGFGSNMRLSGLLSTSQKDGMLDKTGRYYVGPNGEIVTTPPERSTTFEYKQSPLAKFQGVSLMRGLGARGLAGGGIAPYAQAKLAAEDYDKQLGRLAGLVDVGRGAGTSLTNLATNSGNQVSGIQNQLGLGLANSALLSGQARASLYSGLGAQSGNAISNAYNGYKLGQNAGWWGNSGTSMGGGGGSAAAAADAYQPAASYYGE